MSNILKVRIMSISRFTEQDTEAFYDAEDALYRSFWDREGSLHWGWFEEEVGPDVKGDFLAACANLNRIMLEKAHIGADSRVLDLGCGNGNTATWLAGQAGCHVTGVDLSGVRIDNAIAAIASQPAELQSHLTFKKASATELPETGETFSHVWSQATIYHVHDKEKALAEAYRVLEPGGWFVFDDLTKPRPDISDDARRYVYDRLLFDTDFSFQGYQDALETAGFNVTEAFDLSHHLQESYACLSQMAKEQQAKDPETFLALSLAYIHMVEAIRREELGWGLFICRK